MLFRVDGAVKGRRESNESQSQGWRTGKSA